MSVSASPLVGGMSVVTVFPAVVTVSPSVVMGAVALANEPPGTVSDAALYCRFVAILGYGCLDRRRLRVATHLTIETVSRAVRQDGHELGNRGRTRYPSVDADCCG